MESSLTQLCWLLLHLRHDQHEEGDDMNDPPETNKSKLPAKRNPDEPEPLGEKECGHYGAK